MVRNSSDMLLLVGGLLVAAGGFAVAAAALGDWGDFEDDRNGQGGSAGSAPSSSSLTSAKIETDERKKGSGGDFKPLTDSVGRDGGTSAALSEAGDQPPQSSSSFSNIPRRQKSSASTSSSSSSTPTKLRRQSSNVISNMPAASKISAEDFHKMLILCPKPSNGSAGAGSSSTSLQSLVQPNEPEAPYSNPSTLTDDYRTALVYLATARASNWLQLYSSAASSNTDSSAPSAQRLPNSYSPATPVHVSPTSTPPPSMREKKSAGLTVTKDAVPFAIQAGGLSWKKRPFKRLAPDYALKPLPSDDRGYREAGFYELVAVSCDRWNRRDRNSDAAPLNRETDLMRRLAGFVPSYYGVVNDGNGPDRLGSDAYLLLRDTTAAFSRPCVIDIKMGKQTYEPGSTLGKVMKEKSKYPEQSTFGFRITGMNIYDPHSPDADPTDGYRKYDKHFGRGLKSTKDIKSTLLSFFTQAAEGGKPKKEGAFGRDRSMREKGLGGVRNRVIIEMRRQLKKLSAWFKDNESLHFYSSSILFVYEGDEYSDSFDVSKLRMIDFAHVVREEGRDSGYLDGLYGVLRILDEVLNEQEKVGGLKGEI